MGGSAQARRGLLPFPLAAVRRPAPKKSTLTLRSGRQVLEYGTQRLISSGPNIRQLFDGGLVRLKRGGWKVDVFAMRIPSARATRHKNHELSHHCLGDRPSKE